MTVLSMTCSCCGLIYEIPAGKAVLDCPACGTPNARPSAEGPSLEMLRHAVRQRLSCDFHNAENSYQQVLLHHPDEHEALWGRLLCHYGVEYVEDPATKKRMPTVHTVRNKPLRMQPEFETACDFAPPEVAARYRAEAAYIDEAQVAIRLLAEQCPPYDVFICHKTTEPGGSHKTEDYHRAYQLYVLLKEQGVRAFFAPECLNAVAGADYEAGIYHAIHTARVMLVLCSKAAYLTSAWVRSEWTRFLSLMDEGKDLRLVPLVYDHFDLAKLPAEFRMRKLQGLTMGELDSTQKLLEIVGAKPAPDNDDPEDTRLERAFLFLEDGEWARAEEYAEKVLDEKPKSARAYVVKLLAGRRIRRLEELKAQKTPDFEKDSNYEKALRFGDAALKKTLTEAGQFIRERIAEEERTEQYNRATISREQGKYPLAEQQFRALGDYRDAAARAEECRRLEAERIAAEKRREEERRAAAYEAAVRSMKAEEYVSAEKQFRALGGYRDASAKAEECARLEKERVAEMARQAEERRLAEAYDKALLLKNKLSYQRAEKQFRALGDYRDAPAKAEECRKLKEERSKARRKKWSKRIRLTALTVALVLLAVWGHNALLVPEMRYRKAGELLANGEYVDAYVTYYSIKGYRDVDKLLATNEHLLDPEVLEDAQWRIVGNIVTYGQDNGEALQWRVLAVEGEKALLLAEQPVATMRYHERNTSITWEECTLRTWLNEEFLNEAFSEEERGRIALSQVSADKNPKYSTDPGNATQDRLFLLSISEVEKYLPEPKDRKLYDVEGDTHWWWLRSPGYDSGNAAGVWSSGAVYAEGYYVYYLYGAVRPAFWLNLGS